MPVAPEPVTALLRAAPRYLAVQVPWALVVAGRGVCLVAQRVPPVVALVRAVEARRTAVRFHAAQGGPRPDSA